MSEPTTKEWIETLKKSEINIKTEADREEIEGLQGMFLNCHIEEEKETLTFIYDTEGKKPFTMIREEKRIDRLRALLEIGKLQNTYSGYLFTLEPENLYYDRNFRIYVKRREMYEAGLAGETDELVKQYRALCAFALQKKYGFQDYYLGGDDLYKKNTALKEMAFLDTMDSLEEWLLKAYETEKNNVFDKRVEVNKGWYQMNVWYIAVTLFLIAAAAAYIIYTAGVVGPRKDAMIQAQNSYLDGKYVQVIDDLEDVDIKYMDKYLKYILAVSYVKGENLTPEQKENVLETISIDGEEKIKEYWIYLGRLDTLEAENIAMQRSDNQLLLYAYMTEKAMLEKNTTISGEEKASQLDALEQKIKELAELYETEEETE